MRRLSAVSGMLLLLASEPVGALTYQYTFDRPFDWDDVAGPQGLGGHAKWQVLDFGGNPGGVLNVWSDYWHWDMRAVQINAEPGTTARIRFDIKVVQQDPGPSYVRVMYFDGYVPAVGFVTRDEWENWPDPIFEHASGTLDLWQHVDVTTRPLSNSVLTLCFEFQDFQTYYADYLIDNLQVEFVPQSVMRDLDMSWRGSSGGKYVEWRQTTGGQHVAWCDFLEEREGWFDNFGQPTPYPLTYHSWYDTTQNPYGDHAKGDYKHLFGDPTFRASVLRIDFAHDSDHAKMCGIRQTASYESLGLAPGRGGFCTATAQGAIYDEWSQSSARWWLGIDPYGGRDIKEDRYPDCSGGCNGSPLLWDPAYAVGSFRNYYTSGWKQLEIQWERPPDAEAFTVFLKFLDMRGNRLPPGYPWGGASEGADFVADWVNLSAAPEPISIRITDVERETDLAARLSWEGIDTDITVLHSPSLDPADWQPVLAPDPGFTCVVPVDPNADMGFYKLQHEGP